METTRYLETIELGATTIVDAINVAPDAHVSACTPWKVTDLALHVGSLHGWVVTILNGSAVDGPTPPRIAVPSGDAPSAAIVAWCKEQTAMLLSAFKNTDLDRPCWSFREPHTGHFWSRRMALETIIHSFDAHTAIGGKMEIAPDIAVDGINEFLTEVLPRRIEKNPDPWVGETFHLHQTDGDLERLVTLGPSGNVAVSNEHAKGDVAVRGTASDLYLWCLNRRLAEQMEFFGDRAIVDKWESEVFF